MPLTFSSSSRNSSGGYSVSSGTQTSGSFGGSSSQVSLSELEAAINQDLANRASGGGGISFGDSGYVGNNGASSGDISGLLNPKTPTYEATDGKIFFSKSERDSHNSQLQKAAFDADFNRAVSEQLALEKAYEYGTSFTSGTFGSDPIAYTFQDPTTGFTQKVSTLDDLENLYREADVFYSDFNTAISEEAALENAYDLGQSFVSGTFKSSPISYTFTDPLSGEQSSVASIDALDALYAGVPQRIAASTAEIAANNKYNLSPEEQDAIVADATKRIAAGESVDSVYNYYNELAGDWRQGVVEDYYTTRLEETQQRNQESDSFIENLFKDVTSGTMFSSGTGAVLTNVPNTTNDQGAYTDTEGVFVNELGQTYTQEDIDELGARSEGMLKIGNVANRVVTGEGTTGYLIGSGNNAIENLTGENRFGYNLDRTDLAAQGLLSPKPDYVTPSPEPVAEDRNIPTVVDLVDNALEGLLVPKDINPNDLIDFDYPYKAPVDVMDEAIASGGAITADIFPDNYTVKDEQGFINEYTQDRYNVSMTDEALSLYGTGFEGYNNFIGAAEAAKELGSSIFTNEPKLAITPSGEVVATDDLSFENIVTQIGTALGNNVMGRIGGTFIGNFVWNATNAVKPAVYSALATEAGIRGYVQPFEAQVYIDESGEHWIQTNNFGQDSFMTVAEASEKARKSAEKWENSGFSSNSSDPQLALLGEAAALNKKLSTSKPKWSDYYNNIAGDILTNAVIGGITNINLSELGTSTVKAVSMLADGADPLTAVVSAYGDNLAANLPDGWEKPTHVAAQIMLGVSPVQAVAESYGTEVLGDTPMAKASLTGAVLLDQGASTEEIFAKSVYTYFKEGGEAEGLKDALENGADAVWDAVKDLIPEGDGEFNLDLDMIDLGFIEDGAKSAWDYVSTVASKIGAALPEVNISWDGDVPSFPDFPDLDVSGFVDSLADSAQSAVNWINENVVEPVGEVVDTVADTVQEGVDALADAIPSVDIDLPDISLPDFDFPDFDLFGSYAGGAQPTELDAVLGQLSTSEFRDTSTPLSRRLLKRGYKVA